MYACIFLTFVSLVLAFVHADVYESTHLVTMRKAEFMEIIDCVFKSMDPVLCKKFEECQKILPQQVMMATNKCKKECMAEGVKKCGYHESLFVSPEIPNKIFDCVVKNTHKLTSEESKMMVDYEKCIRDFHIKSCKFPKHQGEFHVEYLDGFQ